MSTALLPVLCYCGECMELFLRSDEQLLCSFYYTTHADSGVFVSTTNTVTTHDAHMREMMSTPRCGIVRLHSSSSFATSNIYTPYRYIEVDDRTTHGPEVTRSLTMAPRKGDSAAQASSAGYDISSQSNANLDAAYWARVPSTDEALQELEPPRWYPWMGGSPQPGEIDTTPQFIVSRDENREAGPGQIVLDPVLVQQQGWYVPRNTTSTTPATTMPSGKPTGRPQKLRDTAIAGLASTMKMTTTMRLTLTVATRARTRAS